MNRSKKIARRAAAAAAIATASLGGMTAMSTQSAMAEPIATRPTGSAPSVGKIRDDLRAIRADIIQLQSDVFALRGYCCFRPPEK
jgi:hypothetical protein